MRLRYKLPSSGASKLIEESILRGTLRSQPGESLQFAAAVAAYADALRGGNAMPDWDWDKIATSARAARGHDQWGERAEFVRLVESARQLVGDQPRQAVLLDE